MANNPNKRKSITTKPDKKQEYSIIVIVAVAFIFGLFLSFIYKSLRNSFSQLPANKILYDQVIQSKKGAILSLKTKNNSVKVGQSFNVDIFLSSGTSSVEIADFVVNYDREFLSVEKVSEGTYFKNYPINNVSDNIVKLSGVAGFQNNKVFIPNGDGVVGSITFTALKNTKTTNISFDRIKTIVASAGENIIDKEKISDLTISVQ